MSAPYQALLREGDHYLEQAQGYLDYSSKDPQMATAYSALAQAFYARALLEKPDASGQLLALLAAGKAAAESTAGTPGPAHDNPAGQSMQHHPAGKKRAPRKAAPRSAK